MNLNEILNNCSGENLNANFVAEKFLQRELKDKRFAIGKNRESLALNKIVPLTGLIDDSSESGTFWNGIPLLKTQAVPKDALIVNCSTSISPIAVLHHLKSSGLEFVINFHEIVHASNGRLDLPEFVQSFRTEVESYATTWQSIYNALADDVSKKTFMDVSCFRYTANPSYMSSYSVRLEEQYFEEFMNYQNEVFVDAGGFDGDTAEAFAIRYNDYKKILFFEPSAKNMLAARRRLENFERICYFPVGLSNENGILRFDQNSGSASSVTNDGDDVIQVDTLDVLVNEPVSFIKMDLEGWELKALQGASEHIKRDRPKLAIAVYHSSPDLRLIYEFISKFDLGYKVYLRHYTQGWSETVMFFC